jgi:hypothetical protein
MTYSEGLSEKEIAKKTLNRFLFESGEFKARAQSNLQFLKVPVGRCNAVG